MLGFISLVTCQWFVNNHQSIAVSFYLFRMIVFLLMEQYYLSADIKVCVCEIIILQEWLQLSIEVFSCSDILKTMHAHHISSCPNKLTFLDHENIISSCSGGLFFLVHMKTLFPLEIVELLAPIQLFLIFVFFFFFSSLLLS